jgi:predicted house-cleaning noncanonical NTP pyrophosphatase (MazG superfamily)
MERIVIEVDEETGKKWSLAPAKFRKEVSEKISESISKILDDTRKENFLAYLDEIGEKMKQRGLTEEALNDILKDND